MSLLLNRKKRIIKERGNGKRFKGLIAALLCLALILPLLAPVKAVLATNTPKEEVIYINLNTDGSVEKIYVVNIFDLTEEGEIIDYGDYTMLRNMTSNDEISFEKQKIKIDAKAGKLYYEGELNHNTIPWIFEIRYYLDGKEYSAKDIGGKSGQMKITMSVRENPNCSSVFFNSFALQASLTLDTNNFENIVATGGTLANVGRNKQISYTLLPGKEKDITISAKVRDFEMDGISINGLPLDIDIDLDTENNEEINKEIDKLTDAVNKLDDGANELLDGAGDLRDGALDLKDGHIDLEKGTNDLYDGGLELRKASNDLYKGSKGLKNASQEILLATAKVRDGALDLSSGSNTLYSGSRDLHNGLTDLNGQSGALTNGAYTIFQQLTAQGEMQINAILAGAGRPPLSLTPTNYAITIDGLLAVVDNEAIKAGLGAIKAQLDSYNNFYQGLSLYTQGVDAAASGASNLYNGSRELREGAQGLSLGSKALYDGASELSDGTIEFFDGVTDLKAGTGELFDGIIELKDGVVELLDGAIKMYDGTLDLYEGTIELAEGTLEFKDKTANLDQNLKTKINNAINEMLGKNIDLISFVSSKNINIESVQFVIKTPAIDKGGDSYIEPMEEVKLTFWQKILRLFGWY